MTLKELSQFRDLKREIINIERKIAELEDEATDTSAKITGMPHSGKLGDKIGSIVSQIDYYESIQKKRLAECESELNCLNEYISACPDSLTRQILEYRFIDGMKWNQVAEKIGGTSEYAVKKITYRYIKKRIN